MPEYQCQNAILLIVYKRADTLKPILNRLKSVKPSKIYIAANSYKNEQEKHLTTQVRQFLENNINWDCQVNKLYRDTHLSAKLSISSAISWFFQQEKQGIILEDDCLPTLSFFRFCDELLERYADEEKVFMISGWSALDFAKNTSVETLHPKAQLQEDYFFSKYPHIWGWASWARAWQKYQLEFSDFESEFNTLDNFYSVKEKHYWHKLFKIYAQGKVDTWDYPFVYSMWKHNGLSIYPKNNMIANIGFNRDDATNTTGESKFAIMPSYEIAFPLKHPNDIQINTKLDTTSFEVAFAPLPLHTRILRKVKKCLYKLLKPKQRR